MERRFLPDVRRTPRRQGSVNEEVTMKEIVIATDGSDAAASRSCSVRPDPGTLEERGSP